MKRLPEYAIMPSLISCDLCNLESEIGKMEEAGVECLHADMLDGNFSPSLPIGIDTYKQLSKKTDLKFDVHIMSNNNEYFITEAIKMNPGRICFQVEGEKHVFRYIQMIKEAGIKAGLAFAPATSLLGYKDILCDLDFVLLMRIEPGYAFSKAGKIASMQNKIVNTRTLLHEINPGITLEIDGRVSFGEIDELVKMGADNLVGGSKSMFVNRDYRSNYERMKAEYLEGMKND